MNIHKFKMITQAFDPSNPKPWNHDVLIPYRNKSKWGFSNKRKDTFYKVEYDYCGHFEEGYAIVGLRGADRMKYGVIDYRMQSKIPVIYDYIIEQPWRGVYIAKHYARPDEKSYFYNLQLSSDFLIFSSYQMLAESNGTFLGHNPTYLILFECNGSVIATAPTKIPSYYKRKTLAGDPITTLYLYEVKNHSSKCFELTYSEFLGNSYDEETAEYTSEFHTEYRYLNSKGEMLYWPEMEDLPVDSTSSSKRDFLDEDHDYHAGNLLFSSWGKAFPELGQKDWYRITKSEGVYRIETEQGVGYFNERGELISKNLYISGAPMNNGLARVKYLQNDKVIEGTIDSEGAEFWND